MPVYATEAVANLKRKIKLLRPKLIEVFQVFLFRSKKNDLYMNVKAARAVFHICVLVSLHSL